MCDLQIYKWNLTLYIKSGCITVTRTVQFSLFFYFFIWKSIKYQEFDPFQNNSDSSVMSLNRPIILETTYNLISTHIICAFNSMLHLVKKSVEESLFEKIERLLKMRNKLILSKSIMQKLETIFEANSAAHLLKWIKNTRSVTLKNYWWWNLSKQLRLSDWLRKKKLNRIVFRQLNFIFCITCW